MIHITSWDRQNSYYLICILFMKKSFTHQEFLIILADHYNTADVSKHNV